MALSLAQAANTTTVLVWVGVLIGVVLLGGAAAWAVRRSLLAKEDAQGALGLLESLRAMRDAGTMSAEEYDAARKAIARKASAEREPEALDPSGAPRPRAEPARPAGRPPASRVGAPGPAKPTSVKPGAVPPPPPKQPPGTDGRTRG